MKAAKADDFTFETWLDGSSGYETRSKGTPAPAAHLPQLDPSLPPKFRRLAELIGRRCDDPELVAFVEQELGGKVPGPCAEMGDAKNVKSKTLGITAYFAYDVLNDAFPLVPKSAKTWVRYFTEVSFTNKWPEPLPFGLAWKCTEADLEARVGPTILTPSWMADDEEMAKSWARDLDLGRSYLAIGRREKGDLSLTMELRRSWAVTSKYVPKPAVTGVVVAWLILRDLLDASRFPLHAELIASVARRERQGTAFVDAALGRGLWTDHIADPKVARRLHQWLKNMNGRSMQKDFVELFGECTNEHRHTEPALEDDTWDAIDRAAPKMDAALFVG